MTQADGPFDTKAAARFLGMSASWLEKSRVRGDGPRFRKLGARVVYDREELRAWLQTKGRASTAEYEPKPKDAKTGRKMRPAARPPVSVVRRVTVKIPWQPSG